MQTVTIIQKPVVINANTYKMNFVRHGDQDLEVIDFDESKPGIIEIALSDTEVPTLNFENMVVIQADKDAVQDRATIEHDFCGVPGWLAWDELTTIEKLEMCKRELEAYFNQAVEA